MDLDAFGQGKVLGLANWPLRTAPHCQTNKLEEGEANSITPHGLSNYDGPAVQGLDIEKHINGTNSLTRWRFASLWFVSNSPMNNSGASDLSGKLNIFRCHLIWTKATGEYATIPFAHHWRVGRVTKERLSVHQHLWHDRIPDKTNHLKCLACSFATLRKSHASCYSWRKCSQQNVRTFVSWK